MLPHLFCFRSKQHDVAPMCAFRSADPFNIEKLTRWKKAVKRQNVIDKIFSWDNRACHDRKFRNH